MVQFVGHKRKHNLGEMAFCYLYILRTATGALKMIEIILGITCLALCRMWNILLGFDLDAFAKAGLNDNQDQALQTAFQLLASNDMHNTGIATFIAYLIITPCILIVYLRGQTHVQASDLEFLLNLIGGLMYLGTGGMTLATWIVTPVPMPTMKQNAMAIGALSVINGFVYFVDALLAYKNK